MQEAIGVGEDLDEGAEVRDALDGALVDHANLGLSDQALDDVEGTAHGALVGGRHVDGAVVFDVDLDARLVDDALDGLATGADDDTDLVGLDLDGGDARGPLGHGLSGSGQGLEHLAEDVQTAFASLIEGGGQHFAGQALDLDVHLDGGDATGRATDLEVHVAHVVFVTEDVRENGDLVPFLDETHGDPGDGGLDGHASVHEAEGAAAHGSHRRGAVGLENFADDAGGVGELLVVGNHALERALREVAVTDFASSHRADALDLTGAERGEVVVQKERLVRVAHERVDLLLVGAGAQGGGHEGLGFAALEDGGPMRAREHADLTSDVANGPGAASADAHALLDDHLAHLVPLDVVLVGFLEQLVPLRDGLFAELLDELGEGCLADLLVLHVARLFVGDLQAFADAVDGDFVQALFEVFGKVNRLEAELGLAHGLSKLVDQLDDGLRGLVGEHEGVDEDLLGDLLGRAFDHHDGFLGARDGDVEVAERELLVGGEGDELALDATDADASDRAVPGDVGDVQGSGGAGEGEDLGGVFLVEGPEGGDDLGFCLEAVGEQGTNGAVHEPRGQDLVVAGAGFALEEAAGDLACGIGLLDVVAGQGEEVDAGALVPGGHDGDQDDGFAHGHEHGAAGLLGKTPGLEGDHGVAYTNGFSYEHGDGRLLLRPPARRNANRTPRTPSSSVPEHEGTLAARVHEAKMKWLKGKSGRWGWSVRTSHGGRCARDAERQLASARRGLRDATCAGRGRQRSCGTDRRQSS